MKLFSSLVNFCFFVHFHPVLIFFQFKLTTLKCNFCAEVDNIWGRGKHNFLICFHLQSPSKYSCIEKEIKKLLPTPHFFPVSIYSLLQNILAAEKKKKLLPNPHFFLKQKIPRNKWNILSWERKIIYFVHDFVIFFGSRGRIQ